ncbi:hypothetical protein GC207_15130 [bacterium]|nr:hypothetical protein [bacterium]
MAVPIAFTEVEDWSELDTAIRSFGESIEVTADDLLGALEYPDAWCRKFTDCSVLERNGEQIIWHRYEQLIWALGESFRQIMLRIRTFRRSEPIFEAVKQLCLEQRFGKGRQSFVMLLGQYGGPTVVPTLTRLLSDSEVAGHAIYSLRLLGASNAADDVRPFLRSPVTWIKKEALKYFQKIEPTP